MHLDSPSLCYSLLHQNTPIRNCKIVDWTLPYAKQSSKVCSVDPIVLSVLCRKKKMISSGGCCCLCLLQMTSETTYDLVLLYLYVKAKGRLPQKPPVALFCYILWCEEKLNDATLMLKSAPACANIVPEHSYLQQCTFTLNFLYFCIVKFDFMELLLK